MQFCLCWGRKLRTQRLDNFGADLFDFKTLSFQQSRCTLFVISILRTTLFQCWFCVEKSSFSLLTRSNQRVYLRIYDTTTKTGWWRWHMLCHSWMSLKVHKNSWPVTESVFHIFTLPLRSTYSKLTLSCQHSDWFVIIRNCKRNLLQTSYFVGPNLEKTAWVKGRW